MKYLLLIFIVFTEIDLHGQESDEFSFFAGYGFFEGFHIGTVYHFNEGLSSVSLSPGYQRAIDKNEKTFSISAGYNHVLSRNSINRKGHYRWQLSNRIVLWQLEDDFYIWRVISFTPSLKINLIAFGKVQMSLDAGPAFSYVIDYERKSYAKNRMALWGNAKYESNIHIIMRHYEINYIHIICNFPDQRFSLQKD